MLECIVSNFRATWSPEKKHGPLFLWLLGYRQQRDSMMSFTRRFHGSPHGGLLSDDRVSLLWPTMRIARISKVLSVNTRVRMIELLKDRSLCVNALARHLEITPSAVSQHMRILRDADIVIADKQGYFVHYKVNESTLSEWRDPACDLLSKDEQL